MVDANPYAPPETGQIAADTSVASNLSTSTAAGRWNPMWDRAIVATFFLLFVLGGGLVHLKMESIIFSGIALLLISLASLARELYCRLIGRPLWTAGLLLALQSIAFVLITFAVIAWHQWSPQDASDHGVDWVVLAYCVWSSLVSWTAGYTLPVIPTDSVENDRNAIFAQK